MSRALHNPLQSGLLSLRRALDTFRDDVLDLRRALRGRRFWLAVLMTVVGCSIFSVGINAVLVPHKYMSSGTTGIALLVAYVLKSSSIGLIYWLINGPILLFGWRTMSLKFVVLAIIGVFIGGAAMQLTRGLTLATPDPLMAAILGGVLTGSGVGLYLRFGGISGGVDIIAIALRRKYGIPMATTFVSVNAITIVAGAFLGDLSIAFYTAVAMVTHSYVVDAVQTGFSARKAVIVVTHAPDVLAQTIQQQLGRGVTFLHGSGGMSHHPVRVVYTVINMIELARLKEIIFNIDPDAFLTVNNTAEVIGHRFVTWEEQGFERRPRGGLNSLQDVG